MSGAICLVCWGVLAWFSHHPGPSPLWLSGGALVIAWIGWGLVNSMTRGNRVCPWMPLIIWSVGFRLVAGLGVPLMEDDAARYLWDGWRLITTGNPYDRTPESFFADPTVPENLKWVLDAINHPQIPTIYGPGLQLWFGVAASLDAGQLWPWKLVVVTADLALMWVLWRQAGERVAVMYSWCPLVIFETCFQAHAEVMAILPLVIAWFLARGGHALVSGAFLGLALASKIAVLPAIPFLLGDLKRWRSWLVLSVVFAGLYAPFWIQGGPVDRAGLQVFLSDWEFNSSIVGLLGWVLPGPWARTLPLLVAIVILGRWWLVWRESLPVAARLDWVFGVVLATSAVVNPWYLLWVVPFAAMAPSVTAWVAIGAVSLSYATSMNLGLDLAGPYDHPRWVRLLEYGAIGVTLMLEWWYRHRHKKEPRHRNTPEPRVERNPS